MNSTKMGAEEYDTRLTTNYNINIVHKQKYDITHEYGSIDVKVEPFHEDDGNLYIKNEFDIINGAAEHFIEDHIVKEELCNDPEIIQKDDISKQYNVKQEEKIVDDVTENLYKDHIIIKDEMVIGPEIVQQIVPPMSVACKKQVDKCDCNNTHKCKMYICDYCGKSFIQRKIIKLHLNQHIPCNNKCHVCGKCFSYRQNLARHLTIHSGKKPHECLQCDLSFSRKDYLKVHIQRRHSDFTQIIKPQRVSSVCKLCDKVFASKYSRDHHTKFCCPKNKDKLKQQRNKLYVCDVCNRSYIYRTSLAAHIKRRHTNESLGPLHECGHCGNKYMKKHNLQCHMLAHHLNIKPYKCKICKKTFTWHSTLSSHEKKEHGKVKKTVFF